MRRTKLKVCYIADIDEARHAIRLGADALGLVGQMPSGPGIISDGQARKIAVETQRHISTFLLTSESTAENFAAHLRSVGASTVQIVNHIEPAESEKHRIS